jgi:hypothetical protein
MRKKVANPIPKRPGKKPGVMGKKTGRTLKLSPDIQEFLRRAESASALVETIIRQSRQFRAWVKSRGDGK